mgnify:CR=1 FL=1
MKTHGPWRIVESRDGYRDAWLSVRLDDVIRPDGAPGTHSVVTVKPGVCVVAVDERRQVHLTEEFHYGVGRTTVEGVSGGIEPGERPVDAARRELSQELGIEAREWTDLGVIDPLTTSVVSPTRLFAAGGLTFGTPHPEGTERIRRVCLLLDDAVRMVTRSEITHAPTCVAILKLAMM